MRSAAVSHLDALENESIYILREAYHAFKHLGMLWSIGKDSSVMLWLARKAFFGHVPFPLIHIDTSFKIPEMIAYRDRLAKEWQLTLLVGQNTAALQAGMNHTKGRLVCCGALKTDGLKQLIAAHDIDALLLGIRRDEEGSRGKERVFSPRDQHFEWNFKDQPPEFWDHYNTDFPPKTHVRIHPLLAWTELDVWEYIQREGVPVIDLYFSRDGKRYRSIGCAPCTGTVDSSAATVADVVEELRLTRISERAGRAQDHETEYAMQLLREQGYM